MVNKIVTKKEVIEMSKKLGLTGVSKKIKPELIRIVQEAEGNNPCFKTISNCSVTPCMFRAECQQ